MINPLDAFNIHVAKGLTQPGTADDEHRIEAVWDGVVLTKYPAMQSVFGLWKHKAAHSKPFYRDLCLALIAEGARAERERIESERTP